MSFSNRWLCLSSITRREAKLTHTTKTCKLREMKPNPHQPLYREKKNKKVIQQQKDQILPSKIQRKKLERI